MKTDDPMQSWRVRLFWIGLAVFVLIIIHVLRNHP